MRNKLFKVWLVGMILLGSFLPHLMIVGEVKAGGGGICANAWELAIDEDFEGDEDGEFRYIGDKPCVEIPHVIKGVAVTSYESMFEDVLGLKGVKSNNSNITNTVGMFIGAEVEEFNFKDFDMSGVVHANRMFLESNVFTNKDIILTGDFSNIEYMDDMFQGSMDNVKNVRKVIIQDDFIAPSLANMKRAFMYLDIEEVIIGSNLTLPSLESMEMSFAYSNIEKVDLGGLNFMKKDGVNLARLFMDAEIGNIVLGEVILGDNSNLQGMFQSSEIGKIVIESIEGGKEISLEHLFNGVEVNDLQIGDITLGNDSTISMMFYDLTGGEVVVGNIILGDVANISHMFSEVVANNLSIGDFEIGENIYSNNIFNNIEINNLEINKITLGEGSEISHVFGGEVTNLRVGDIVVGNGVKLGYFIKLNFDKVELGNILAGDSFNLEYLTMLGWGGSHGEDLIVGDISFGEGGKISRLVQGDNINNIHIGNIEGGNNSDLSYLTNGVKSNELIVGNITLGGNSKLMSVFQNLEIDNFGLGDVKVGVDSSLGYMFLSSRFNNNSIGSFNIGDGANLSGMFLDSTMSDVDFSKIKAESISQIDNMFTSFKGQENVDLSGLDVEGLSIVDIFSDSELKEGLAKSQEDVDYFNGSEDKPIDLWFTVKEEELVEEDIIIEKVSLENIKIEVGEEVDIDLADNFESSLGNNLTFDISSNSLSHVDLALGGNFLTIEGLTEGNETVSIAVKSKDEEKVYTFEVFVKAKEESNTGGSGNGNGSGGSSGGSNTEGSDNSPGDNQCVLSYVDLTENHWAYDYIKEATCLGFVKGIEKDGKLYFSPNKEITRAEIVAIILRSMGIDYEGYVGEGFIDIEGRWYEDVIAKAKDLGIARGYLDGLFRGDKFVSRSELSEFIHRAFVEEEVNVTENKFKDLTENHWAYDSIVELSELGVIKGVKEDEFGIGATATRSQAVAMLVRVVRLLDN